MSSRGSELTLNTKRMMGHKDERKPEKRRLVIRPIKVQPRLGEDLAEETMKRLEEAFMCIQEGKPLEKSMEELYRSVEDLCIHKKAEVLFGRLKRLMEVEAQRNVDTLSKLNGEKGELLESVAFIWNEHCRQMKIIRSIFLYLDRSYVHLLKDAKSLWELSLQLYKNKFEFQQNKNLDDAIIKEALHVIQKERDGELISHGLLNTVVRMLTALKFYSKLESRFLSDSKKYYLNESEHVFVSASIPEYLVYTLKRIREEEERIQNYLNPSTLEPLVHVVRDEFIRNRASDILKKGFTKLLDSESIDNLKKMYSLFSSVSQLPKLNLAFGEYIINTGSVIVKDPSKDQDMVQDLLKLKVKLDIALKSAFDDDADFSQTIKVSFENFINLRKNKPAELVAKYLDGILRSGNRTASEKEAEDILNSVMVIFRYIDGKDVFEAFYKKDLAKRLILGKCASVEAERSMISKLRLECGHSFTNKLEGMFSDIEVSNKLLSEFKQFCIQNQEVPEFDFNVHVLTMGHWPTYPKTMLRLPTSIVNYQDLYTKFYTSMSKHNQRVLTWQHSLAQAILEANFPNGIRALEVSAYQACVLLLFNNGQNNEILSYEQLRSGTDLDEDELKSTLLSLIMPPFVLKKKPPSKTISNTDLFKVNVDFTSRLYRVKINQIQAKETEEEQKATTAKVFGDRQYAIDACLVRIMKSRKQLSHSLLISEAITQLKFPVEVSDIKQRISSLLEREYIERDKDNSSTYNYLA